MDSIDQAFIEGKQLISSTSLLTSRFLTFSNQVLKSKNIYVYFSNKTKNQLFVSFSSSYNCCCFSSSTSSYASQVNPPLSFSIRLLPARMHCPLHIDMYICEYSLCLYSRVNSGPFTSVFAN